MSEPSSSSSSSEATAPEEDALPRRLLAVTGRAAVRAGRAIAAGVRAVDPDLRMHLALLPLAGLSGLVGGGATPLVEQPDDGHRVLVFVHGLGGQPGNFVGLRAWFRRQGRTRQFALSLGTGDLDAMAEALAEQLLDIDRLCLRRGRDEPSSDAEGASAGLDLVAHSMGGVVARLALRDPRVAARVTNLVTLGTPHHGTWLARYADTTLTRALRPASATLEALAAQLPWPGPPALPRLHAFWSNADMILLPHETARVPGAENHELVGASHFGYLLRPGAWRAIGAVLANNN